MYFLRTRIFVLSLVLTSTVCGLATGALDSAAFSSLGVLDLSAGAYTIDTTTGLLTDDATGATLFTGVPFNQSISSDAPFYGWNPELTVFTFDRIMIGATASVRAHGENPLVLLSKSEARIDGDIDASGENGDRGIGNLVTPGGTGLGGRGGPGGGKGGDGADDAPPGRGYDGEGPGYGFGGFGGTGTRGNGAGFGGFGGGGFGGTVTNSSYGDLKQFLQGGSGGGGAGRDLFLITKGPGGGGGGGGVEIGAATSLTHTSRSRVLQQHVFNAALKHLIVATECYLCQTPIRLIG
ncbi:MAG: hypothetical protein R3E01_27790 [Pirellulaceae bacterium]